MKKINMESMKMFFLFSFISALFLTSCTKKETAVWVASPWERVLRSTPSTELQKVELKAASNEYEPFRIIIHNTSDHMLSDLNVMVSSLTNKDIEISSDNIRLFRAHYLNVTKASNRTKNPLDGYPDALIPFLKEAVQSTYVASPFSIDTSVNAEVWCDLYVPAGTTPGTYVGEVTVTMGKKKIAKIPVSLEVWDFELPSKISMLSHFGNLNSAAVKMMGIEGDSAALLEMTEHYNQELLKHRAVPSTPANAWPEWNEKDGIIDNGASERMKKLVEQDHFNALNMPFRYEEEPKKCIAYLAAMAEWLRGLGYLEMSYIYLEDEPNDAKQYEIVRRQGNLIKSADPGIGRMCTEQTVTSNPEWGNLYGAVSIWCPLWGLWDEQTAKERLAQGEKIWSYTALCQGKEGTPWWQIDMEPLNYRSPFWTSWHYDITGYLYWNSTWWNTYENLEGVYERPFFRDNFWGEGSLLYPGQPAGIKGFVPSMRLKLYREAMEDYEYMVLASGLGKDEDVDKIVDGVATSFQNWSHENADYEMARQKLAELITGAKQ